MSKISQEMINSIADALNVTPEKAESLLKAELKRKEASIRYRQSAAYKQSLELQKEARRAIKEMGF